MYTHNNAHTHAPSAELGKVVDCLHISLGRCLTLSHSVTSDRGLG